MDRNHDEQVQGLTFIEGLKEDLAWVGGAGIVAAACWLFIGDDYAYLLIVPVLAAVYFAAKTIRRRVTNTPRHRRRIGLKTIFWSVAAGVTLSVVLGFVWDSYRGSSPDSEAADSPDWLVTAVRNSPLAPPCSSTEEVEYMETQTETLLQHGPLLKRMTRLFTDPPGGQLDLEDEEWQRQISVILVDMEELGEDLRDYRPVPESLEETHGAMADIGDSITRQADTYRSILQALYDGNHFEALGHQEEARSLAEACEGSVDILLQQLAEECEFDRETP